MSYIYKECVKNNYDLRVLLAELRKAVELWFFNTNSQQCTIVNENVNYRQFIEACIEILKHGLIIKEVEESNRDIWSCSEDEDGTQSGTHYAFSLQKFKDDFEWLLTITQLRHRKPEHSSYAKFDHFKSSATNSSIHQFLFDWLCKTIKSKSLCACVQALITDKELIDLYYNNDAFLQSEAYANAFCICIKAMELQQYNLLSQLDAHLYQMAGDAETGTIKRYSGSHPNLSFLENDEQKKNLTKCLFAKYEYHSKHRQQLGTAIRKSKSLPVITFFRSQSSFEKIPRSRPRCKTLGTRLVRNYGKIKTAPRMIPKRQTKSSTKFYSNNNSSYSQDECDMLPSTSANSRNQFTHNATSPTTSEIASLSSTGTTRNIEIINCDNIKIWTDQTLEQHNSPQSSCSTVSGDLLLPPMAFHIKPSKSASPINNFFANLFGTPPTYTSWSPQKTLDAEENNVPLDIAHTTATFPCNTQKSSSVFDAFLPTYGKKLRTRKSQNLFDEDGISTLDYNTKINCTSPAMESEQKTKEQENVNTRINGNQNLSDYLKFSHLSRHNTDLEKENAHFTISEAIITAIEHIKWAKTAPDKRRQLDDDTKTATDWLEKERDNNAVGSNNHGQMEPHEVNEFAEHIPYAELGCFDELSAEIIGLTLISKFNDKQLPKVSELKWLVADDDTPQKLLPMPDDSPTANPDEHVTPKMTRGTRYWAPPRQQIIFTDHQVPNRRELIQKQNYRCSGCGMRISPQNMQSFRYCTYFGKYHCTGCHRNQMSPTPAKILTSWDFKCYPVSVFAYRLLEQMFTYPLFYVPDLNASLYTQSKALLTARQKRRQLNFIKDFIRLCRFAIREQQYFQQIPNYITDDPDLWSMSDFIDVQEKSMKRSIEDLIIKCENHIHNCVLCRARGFYCEHCRKDHIIFPWENKIFRCDRCGSCYHLHCWRSIAEICYKCQRLIKRRHFDVT